MYRKAIWALLLTTACVRAPSVINDEGSMDYLPQEIEYLPQEIKYLPQQPIVTIPQDDSVVVAKYVHQYGVTMPQLQWKELGQSGEIILTRKDGVTCRRSYYYGVLDGDTSYTYPFSDAVEKVETYAQDVLTKEVTYNPRGQKRSEKIYHPQEPTLVREWYENGVLKSFEKYSGSLVSYGEYYDMQGKRMSDIENGAGHKTVHDSYGMLVGIEAFHDGKTDTQTSYYTDGSPKEITPYKNGKVHGLRKTYFQGGEPKTIETWVEGRQEGITTLFQDGEKTQEVRYKNGLKNDICRVFKDGAVVVQEITYKDDKMHGPTRTYIEDRVATEWYFKGNQVTKGYYDSFHFQPKPQETLSEEMRAPSAEPPTALQEAL